MPLRWVFPLSWDSIVLVLNMVSEEARAILSQAIANDKFIIHCILDTIGLLEKSIALLLALCRHAWLRSTSFLGDVQASLMDMPFVDARLCGDKEDSVQERFKDSRAAAQLLSFSTAHSSPNLPSTLLWLRQGLQATLFSAQLPQPADSPALLWPQMQFPQTPLIFPLSIMGNWSAAGFSTTCPDCSLSPQTTRCSKLFSRVTPFHSQKPCCPCPHPQIGWQRATSHVASGSIGSSSQSSY